jgi:hypothetical protein
VLEPIFEADLQPEQYAYRRDRSALDAVRRVHKLTNSGQGEVVEADLSSYFDSLPHAELLKSVARRVVDGAMLHLIKMWLEAAMAAGGNAEPAAQAFLDAVGNGALEQIPPQPPGRRTAIERLPLRFQLRNIESVEA